MARPGGGLRLGHDLGLLIPGRGGAAAAAPGGLRRRGPADDRPDHGRADRDDAALQEVSVRARVRGFLKEIHFREGADVKKGQLLFVIDEEPFKAKLADAQATLEEAEAALKKARDSKAREVAAAQLALGQSMLALAEVEERREQLLQKRNAATRRGCPAQAGDPPEGRGAGRGR